MGGNFLMLCYLLIKYEYQGSEAARKPRVSLSEIFILSL